MRWYLRALLTSGLNLGLVGGLAGTAKNAYGNILVERSAAKENAADWEFGAELGGGVFHGERGDDRATLTRTMVGGVVRYRFLYLEPVLELHYLHIDYTDAAIQTKLSSSSGLAGDPLSRQFRREIVVGGTLGGVIPPALWKNATYQVGAFVDGRVTPWALTMSFDELIVFSQDLLSEGRQNLTVRYKWWTTTLAGFVTWPLTRPKDSAVSLAAGWFHFDLEVEVKAAPNVRYRSTYENSGEEITENQPVGILRYGLPFGAFGLEFITSAAKDASWLYRLDALGSVRF